MERWRQMEAGGDRHTDMHMHTHIHRFMQTQQRVKSKPNSGWRRRDRPDGLDEVLKLVQCSCKAKDVLKRGFLLLDAFSGFKLLVERVQLSIKLLLHCLETETGQTP